MNKIYNKSQVLGGAALAAFVLAVVLMVSGMANTVNEIRETAISRAPEAILASAGLDEGEVVSLPVSYYDQKADDCVNAYEFKNRDALSRRQFEWTRCDYQAKGLEQGLVDYYLSEDYLPVALSGGRMVTNKGVNSDAFERWFSAVDGKSASYPGMLQMKYDATMAEFSFYNESFYPLDEVQNELSDLTRDAHNHLFTMNFSVPFTALADGNEAFEIEADDDTWVYVGDKLVIDMGGVHNAIVGKFMINEDGEVYSGVQDEDLAFSGVSVPAGESAIVRIFHADRDSADSRFNMKFIGMNLATEKSEFASNDEEEGVQIAYDPSDPTYQAPLGVTSVVQPDTVKGFILIATIEGVFVVIFAVLMAVSLRFIVKAYRENKEKRDRMDLQG